MIKVFGYFGRKKNNDFFEKRGWSAPMNKIGTIGFFPENLPIQFWLSDSR